MAVFLLTFLAVSLTFASADPLRQERIIGGTETTIEAYPFSAAILLGRIIDNFQKECGGTIINDRAVLTAAHCVDTRAPTRLRIRVGSVYANSGGVVSNIKSIYIHRNFRPSIMDSDIGVIHSATNFVFGDTVQPALIAGPNFILRNNASVTAIGWGDITDQGPRSEILREVQLSTVNPVVCRIRYAGLGRIITRNMLCAGGLDLSGRGQCLGDNGSPLIHNNIIVGVRSWGQGCGLGRYPGVNTRVSRFSNWILSIA